MPLLLQKMLTPDMRHSSFFGNQTESFDGIAERKMCDIAQNDCITRISAKSCETTAKYFNQDVMAKPMDPYMATLYNDCKEKLSYQAKKTLSDSLLHHEASRHH